MASDPNPLVPRPALREQLLVPKEQLLTLEEQLLALEEQLLALGSACDPACVESLLAADFFEFGASGHVWTRAEMLQELRGTAQRIYALSDVACQPLHDSAALLTYRLRVDDRASLRSSLWVHRQGRWQMLFHQGTPVS